MTIYVDIATVYDVTLLVICGYALFRGGRPERWGAVINLGGSGLSSVARLSGVASWAPGEWIVFVIDLGVAIGFYRLAITTTRFWPIWALGFALADLFVSVAGRFLPGTVLLAYETGLSAYAYLSLFALALGTWRLPADASPQLRSGARPCLSQTKPSGSASGSNSPDPSSSP